MKAQATSLFLACFVVFGNGKLECSESNQLCEELYGDESICRDDGKCSVPPLHKGCLQSILPDWRRKRVCNSDDPPNAPESGLCDAPELPYTEIRLFGGNWDSRLYETWVVQIILSELLGVPVTVEGGIPEATLNFYDSTKSLNYGASDSAGALEHGHKISDCTIASRDPENYQPCAHATLEVWDADNPEFTGRILDGVLEPPTPLGVLGSESFFVTKYTLQNDTTLGTYFGLQGEDQRQKLAETFLRPTKWKDYCDQVSVDKCATDDGISKRYPEDHEYDRMFVEGQFIGHFRATEENDCSLNNETFKCTGHVGQYPCGWSSYVEAQMYYLGIGLKSSGDEPNSQGYKYHQLVEMWYAANATKSNLMIFWWTPEPLYQQFMGTDAEMTWVSFPPATQECIDNRVHTDYLCDDSWEVRIGSPLGVCETPTKQLAKAFVSSLASISKNPKDPDALHSPAYDMLRLFEIDEYQLNEIASYQKNELSSRQAVCRWAADHIPYLESFLPRGYPRTIKEHTTTTALEYITPILGACVTFFVMLVAWKVHREREKEAVKLAQVSFLQLLLLGSFLISVGAILTGLKPLDWTCVASVWLLNVGYTLELVPLIIKVAAICRITEAARRMQRVVLAKEKLLGVVAIILLGILVYLVIWTVADKPKQQTEYILTGEQREHGGEVIRASYYCTSESEIWEFIAVGWNVVLLSIASIWAFQMRQTHSKLNETATLAFMIYSHFVFVMLRVATFLLSDNVERSVLRHIRSLIYSVDTVATILIYFIPKLYGTQESVQTIWGNIVRRTSGTHADIIQVDSDVSACTDEYELDVFLETNGFDEQQRRGISNRAMRRRSC